MSLFPRRIPWTKKPNQPKWDFSNPIVSNATSLLSLTNRGAEPYDDAEKASWTADTTNGSTPYQYQPVDGSMQFARQDIDEAGICYKSSTFQGTSNTNPLFVFLSFTVLAAPTAASKGIFQVADVARDGTPNIFLGAQDASNLRLYARNGYRFTDIPVTVGKKQFIIYCFDGANTHDFYASSKGVWETYAGGALGATASTSLWLGTGYNAELPASFEQLVVSDSYTPSLAELKSLAKNPCSLFQPRTQYIDLTAVAAPSGGIINQLQGSNMGADLFNGALQ